MCYGKYVEVIGQPTAASRDQIGHEAFTISECPCLLIYLSGPAKTVVFFQTRQFDY